MSGIQEGIIGPVECGVTEMRKIILAGLMAATAIAPRSPALAQVQFAQRDHDRRGNNHADRKQSRGENRVERQESGVERSQARAHVRMESRTARSVERQDQRGPERNWRVKRKVNCQIGMTWRRERWCRAVTITEGAASYIDTKKQTSK